MKNFNEKKFKKALLRMMLAFAILIGLALVVNILCWIVTNVANLIK